MIEFATIYIPRSIDSAKLRHIASGSGIVGAPDPRAVDQSVVCYEGNLYHAVNLVRLEDRILCAAGRLFENYPTVARMWFTNAEVATELEAVGRVSRDYTITWYDESRAKAYGSLYKALPD